jgi:hypothetical protein
MPPGSGDETVQRLAREFNFSETARPRRQHAVAAALASVRAEGLEPGAGDLALFAGVAAGPLSADGLRERALSRCRR